MMRVARSLFTDRTGNCDVGRNRKTKIGIEVIIYRAFLALCKSMKISDSVFARYMGSDRSSVSYHKKNNKKLCRRKE